MPVPTYRIHSGFRYICVANVFKIVSFSPNLLFMLAITFFTCTVSLSEINNPIAEMNSATGTTETD
ncbi:MAG: hypothetical protein EA359_10780 [Balneolaceae bacterium]|nr:MAG: hypothetical protein EA359_10780 [Balneolaceae bacterium]